MNNTSHGIVSNEHAFSEAVITFLVTVIAILSVVTSLWNSILIFVILRTAILHTFTNAVIVSVAFSNVLIGALVMPFTAITWYNGFPPFSDDVCSFNGVLTSLSEASVSYGVLAVSLDRCAAMSRPLQYNHFINRRSISVMLCILWSLSLAFSIIPIFGWGKYIYSNDFDICMLDLINFRSYSLMTLITCHVLPAVAILVTLLVIVNEARSHHRVITIAQLAIAMYSGPATANGFNYSRSTFRAMRTFLIIICVHLAMFVPSPLYKLSVAANPSVESKKVFFTFTMLSFVSCLGTPVTISTFNGKFKLSIQLIFKRTNLVRPSAIESETFTITSGLQSVLDTSMKFMPGSLSSRDQKVIPGTSGQAVSGASQRKLSILPEVNSSTANTPSPDKAVSRKKSSSFPN